MTVKELIEKLRGVDEDAQVLLATDEEGNEFCKLYGVYDGYFLEKREFEKSGRFDELCTYGETESEDESFDKTGDELDGDDCTIVVLYPV